MIKQMKYFQGLVDWHVVVDLGIALGLNDGFILSVELGVALGVILGGLLGLALGVALGVILGGLLGMALGGLLGSLLGVILGTELGRLLGMALGVELGGILGMALGSQERTQNRPPLPRTGALISSHPVKENIESTSVLGLSVTCHGQRF
jgi:hypothetical protein